MGERLECYSLLTEAKDCGMKRPRKMFVHVYGCRAWTEASLQHCPVKASLDRAAVRGGGEGVGGLGDHLNIHGKLRKPNKAAAARKARTHEYMTDVMFVLCAPVAKACG